MDPMMLKMNINYIRSRVYKARSIVFAKISILFASLFTTNILILFLLGTIKELTGIEIKLIWAGTSLMVCMLLSVIAKFISNYYNNVSQRVLYEY